MLNITERGATNLSEADTYVMRYYVVGKQIAFALLK